MPGGLRLGISIDNTESWVDPYHTELSTNINISGANITTTISRRKDNTNSSTRNMSFVLAPGGFDFTAGVRYKYSQSGKITRGTFNIAGANFGGIASSTVTGIKTTNTGQVYSKVSDILGDGYNDGVTVTHTFTPAFKMGDLSIYVPIQLAFTGTAQKAIETNITETPTNAVQEVSHSNKTYLYNDKGTRFAISPSATLRMDNLLSNLVVGAGVTFGMGLAPVSNTVYSLESETGKDTAITNQTSTLNIVAWNGYLDLPLGVDASISWIKQVNKKIRFATQVKAHYSLDLIGYQKYTHDSTSVNTNGLYSYRTESTTSNAVNNFSSYLNITIPFGLQWMVADWFGINLGTELSYTSTYFSTKTISGTPSYFSDSGGITNQSSGNYAPYSTATSGSSFTYSTFSSGFTWRLTKQLYLDGLLSTTIADDSLVGGNGYFLFGKFFDQFTDSTKWNLEMRLLF